MKSYSYFTGERKKYTIWVAPWDASQKAKQMKNQTQSKSKASLRLRLFIMMKYMHQYKQKRWKHFGLFQKYLSSIPYLNLLKSRFNHCPDSAIQ